MSNTNYSSAEDFWSDPFGGKGQLLYNWPEKRVWIRCDEETGAPVEECTIHYIDPIIEANKQKFNDSEGKRWGTGQIVASIPMDMYYRRYVPMKQAGDDAGLKRFLDNPDNRNLRTFKGAI